MCIQGRTAPLGALAILSCLLVGSARAQSDRVPVAVPRTEERQQTIYRPEYVTEMRDVYRTVYTPVTTYHWEARWRPLQSPHWVWQAVPHVTWQTRLEKSSVPVASQHYVAETKTVRTPYLALGFKPRETSPRTAADAKSTPSRPASSTSLAPQTAQTPPTRDQSSLASLPAGPAATTAPMQTPHNVRVGGILRMDNDPPRRGRLMLDSTMLR